MQSRVGEPERENRAGQAASIRWRSRRSSGRCASCPERRFRPAPFLGIMRRDARTIRSADFPKLVGVGGARRRIADQCSIDCIGCCHAAPESGKFTLRGAGVEGERGIDASDPAFAVRRIEPGSAGMAAGKWSVEDRIGKGIGDQSCPRQSGRQSGGMGEWMADNAGDGVQHEDRCTVRLKRCIPPAFLHSLDHAAFDCRRPGNRASAADHGNEFLIGTSSRTELAGDRRGPASRIDQKARRKDASSTQLEEPAATVAPRVPHCPRITNQFRRDLAQVVRPQRRHAFS